MRSFLFCVMLGAIVITTGCATFKRIDFPPSNEIFITTGDGDITKPYKPIGQLIYLKTGFRIGAPIIGLLPIADVSAEDAINEIIAREAKKMGGNAVINLDVQWLPPSNGVLGAGAHGGQLLIQGTVIQR